MQKFLFEVSHFTETKIGPGGEEKAQLEVVEKDSTLCWIEGKTDVEVLTEIKVI